MKQLFQIGQPVTLIKDGPFYHDGDPFNVSHGPDPVFGEIYHVRGYDIGPVIGLCILLREFPQDDCWDQTDFAPIISDEQLEMDLQEAIYAHR